MSNVSSTTNDYQEPIEENAYNEIIQYKKQNTQDDMIPENNMDQENNKPELRTVIKVDFFFWSVILCVINNHVA